jgi:hypothetical protein
MSGKKLDRPSFGVLADFRSGPVFTLCFSMMGSEGKR